MNFRVVSAPEKRLTEEMYPQFKKDYMDSDLDYHKLKAKYGLSKKEYGEVARRVREEENITTRPSGKAKYFYPNGNRWVIVKSINGNRIDFGSLPMKNYSQKKMRAIVEKCKEWGWDYEKCTEYINSLPYR